MKVSLKTRYVSLKSSGLVTANVSSFSCAPPGIGTSLPIMKAGKIASGFSFKSSSYASSDALAMIAERRAIVSFDSISVVLSSATRIDVSKWIFVKPART